MLMNNMPPREGDLYKILEVGGHRFELRFGFYAEFERENGVPVVIYPDLYNQRVYADDGRMLVTAVQDPCPHYTVPAGKTKDECCCDCQYYFNSGDDVGICACAANSIFQIPRDGTNG